jgi:hypothetical protein
MNPTVITYVGPSILIWGSVTLVQHTHAQKKLPAEMHDSWIIIRPLSSDDEGDEDEPNPLLDAYLRGQHNGPSFKSKRLY